MDEATARTYVDAHAAAIERGEMDSILDDFAEALRPQVPQLAQALPQPVNTAEVVGLFLGEDECAAVIHYTGGTGEATIRSRWREEGGRPVIVSAEPVS